MLNTVEISRENESNETWSPEKINELLGLTEEEKEPESPHYEEETEANESPKTKKTGTFARNPYLKLGLIAAICGMGVLFLGLIFTNAPSYKSLRTKHDPTNSKKTQQLSNTSEEQIAIYKAEAALSTQSQQIKEMGERLDSDAPLPQPVVEETPSQIEAAPPVAVKPNVTKPPRSYNRPQQGVQVVRFPNKEVSSEPKRTINPQKTKIERQKPAIDAQKQWQLLAQMGSYSATTDVTGYNEQEFPPATKVLENPQTKTDPTINNRSPVILTSQRQNIPEGELLGESSVLRRILPVGTLIKGEIVTSIIWAQGMEGGDPFVVTLSEPIRDPQGIEVVAKGTEIIFAVKEIRTGGMVIADAIALLVNGQEMELPPGVFGLKSKGGKPLIAKLRNDARADVARRDAMGFVIGALGKVGEISNRATSTSSFSGYGGISQSETYDSPNYIGAVLEGGFEPLSEQIQERNGEEIDQLENRERLWYLGEGTKVQIQINRTLEF